MRDVDQATLLAVLRDKIEADGGADETVRRWVAETLAGLRIAGPWERTAGRNGSTGVDGQGNPLYRAWRRPHLGQQAGYAASLQTGGGYRTGDRVLSRTWGGSCGSLRLASWAPEDATWQTLPEVEDLTVGMAVLDARLEEEGWIFLPAIARVCPDCRGYGFRQTDTVTRCPNCYGDGEDHGGSRGLEPQPIVLTQDENDAG